MTPIERVCDVLEAVLLNGPISFQALRRAVPHSAWIIAGDLVRLSEAGFVELDPPLGPSSIDPPPATVVDVGDRLRLILDNRRPSA